MPNIGGPQLRESGVRNFPCLVILSDALRQSEYQRVRRLPLNLSVLKLDGSSFDIQVARTASVAELKRAVEDVFSWVSVEGRYNISWTHVWSHFCLCYKRRKLVDDKAYIRNFGIRDGDQICFVRHLSADHKPMKRQLRNGTVLEHDTA